MDATFRQIDSRVSNIIAINKQVLRNDDKELSHRFEDKNAKNAHDHTMSFKHSRVVEKTHKIKDPIDDKIKAKPRKRP
jgi:hypothetical protein